MKKKRQIPTREEYVSKVRDWLQEGKLKRSAFVIIAFDQSKGNLFSVFVSNSNALQQKIKSFNDNAFVNALEVYNLSMDLEIQLKQGRSWNV